MKGYLCPLTLTDPDIQDAPLIFMTGHDTDITTSRNLNKDRGLTSGFSAAERAALRDRRSPDVHRFMANLFIYAMKYGGNVNRL